MEWERIENTDETEGYHRTLPVSVKVHSSFGKSKAQLVPTSRDDLPRPDVRGRTYFGAATVKARTIWLKRYWNLASVSSMSAWVFCSSPWVSSTMEPRPRL